MRLFVFLLGLMGYLCVTASAGVSGTWHCVGFAGEPVRAVAVDPWNTYVVFASTGSGLFRSTDRGLTFEKVRDGFHYPVFDPFDSLKIYGLLSTGSRSDGIWLSRDRGDSWNLLTWKLYPTALSVLFPDRMMLGTKGGGVFWSQDSGLTWLAVNDGLADLDIYSLLFFDPTDSNPTFLAGTGKGIYRLTPPATSWDSSSCPNLPVRAFASTGFGEPLYAAVGAGTYSDGIYGSKDNGATWEVKNWAFHPTSVVINSLDPKIIFAADSGDGVFISRDSSATWTGMNQGLGNLAVLGLALSPFYTTRLFAATLAGLWFYEDGPAIEEGKVNSGIQVSVPTINRRRVAIRYSLPVDNDRVEISIFDAAGALVKRSSEPSSIGWHNFSLVLKRSGVFFIKMKSDHGMLTEKIILL